MTEIYVIINENELRGVAILDKETLIKFNEEGSLEGRQVLICSTEKSFVIKAGQLKEREYKFELMP